MLTRGDETKRRNLVHEILETSVDRRSQKEGKLGLLYCAVRPTRFQCLIHCPASWLRYKIYIKRGRVKGLRQWRTFQAGHLEIARRG